MTAEDRGRDLMLAFQRGNDAAFDALVDHAKREVFALAYRYGLDAARADDLSQEVFLRVWKSRATYKPSAPFRAWLLRIASNLIVSEARSRKRARATALPDDTEGGTPLADPRAESPDMPLERQELRAAIDRALADMPEAQRMALILNRFHEASYEEVGEALSLSPEAVKSLLFRARQSLKQRLEAFAKPTETPARAERLNDAEEP